jgi:tRNA-(ms[2]io[6]A)-hydroxylase
MGKKSIDLLVATPLEWTKVILDDFDAFLCDHANCERKASALAMSLIVKHPDRELIIPKLIDLAQEELLHFRQVYDLMLARGLHLVRDEADPYVNQLLQHMRHGRDERFLDRMLVSSLVECRGAERFGLLCEVLTDPPVKALYTEFWKAERKHGHLFVDLVLKYYDTDTGYGRLDELAESEANIVRELPWRASLH